jgi:hypothetical protein
MPFFMTSVIFYSSSRQPRSACGLPAAVIPSGYIHNCATIYKRYLHAAAGHIDERRYSGYSLEKVQLIVLSPRY